MIASLIEALRETGKLNRTYIFFTSDHGYHLGEHRLPEGSGAEDAPIPQPSAP